METAGVYTDIYIVIARNVAVFPRNVAMTPCNLAITIIRMKTMIKNHYTIKVEIEMILHWMV